MRLIDSDKKEKSNVRSMSAAKQKRKNSDLGERLQYHLHAEMQERIRDLEADVEELARNQQRLQQRLLRLVRHLLGKDLTSPED